MIQTLSKIVEIMYSFPIYGAAYAYCVWRIAKRARKTSLAGIGDESAAGELIICMFCPVFFALADITATIILKLKSKWTWH